MAEGGAAIRSWYDRVMSGTKEGGRTVLEKRQSLFTQAGESVVVGGVLGALEAELPGGLDVAKIPIDGVAGILGLLAGAGSHELSPEIRGAGASALSVFAFRKTYALLAAKKLQLGHPVKSSIAKVHGEISEGVAASDMGADPIIEAAKAL